MTRGRPPLGSRLRHGAVTPGTESALKVSDLDQQEGLGGVASSTPPRASSSASRPSHPLLSTSSNAASSSNTTTIRSPHLVGSSSPRYREGDAHSDESPSRALQKSEVSLRCLRRELAEAKEQLEAERMQRLRFQTLYEQSGNPPSHSGSSREESVRPPVGSFTNTPRTHTLSLNSLDGFFAGWKLCEPKFRLFLCYFVSFTMRSLCCCALLPFVLVVLVLVLVSVAGAGDISLPQLEGSDGGTQQSAAKTCGCRRVTGRGQEERVGDAGGSACAPLLAACACGVFIACVYVGDALPACAYDSLPYAVCCA